jgi:hypothetical protein
MMNKKAIELALLTWYPLDHHLHLNPRPPLGKLLGEWGELHDDYFKGLYKPGYIFEPKNELGDIWYYLRILSYQTNNKFGEISRVVFPEIDFVLTFSSSEIDTITNAICYQLSKFTLTNVLCDNLAIDTNFSAILNANFTAIKEIAKRYELTLNDLTASNWEKLKPGSKRGEEWMNG